MLLNGHTTMHIKDARDSSSKWNERNSLEACISNFKKLGIGFISAGLTMITFHNRGNSGCPKPTVSQASRGRFTNITIPVQARQSGLQAVLSNCLTKGRRTLLVNDQWRAEPVVERREICSHCLFLEPACLFLVKIA